MQDAMFITLGFITLGFITLGFITLGFITLGFIRLGDQPRGAVQSVLAAAGRTGRRRPGTGVARKRFATGRESACAAAKRLHRPHRAGRRRSPAVPGWQRKSIENSSLIKM
jgi:hypothetical protein